MRRFFATTRVPDELYIQSIVSDCPGLRVVDQMTSYANFPPGAVSPAWLDRGSIDDAARTPGAVAGKLPSDARKAISAADALAGPGPHGRGDR